MEMREITNRDDYFDSRDVIERIEELETTQTDLAEAGEDMAEWEADELTALREFAAEGKEATEEWEDGATFIRDSYFEDYAREFARDIGAISGEDMAWPLNRIDWEEAASDLQMDYTSVEWDGVTYWVR